MKAKLVSITQPVIDGITNPEHLIAYCARVSNPKNQTNSEYRALLAYLKRNKEWSPFEMVNVTIEVTTTRDISRQMIRHRSFHFQEFSQRYSPVNKFPVIREVRMQDPENRQSSLPCEIPELIEGYRDSQIAAWDECVAHYNWALSQGIAKEQARCILPEGMTETTLYMNGTARSWMHYLELRLDKGTQKEHREVAQGCLEILKKEMPNVFEHL